MGVFKIVTVVGARPQFVKAAAVSRAIIEHNKKTVNCEIVEKIIHTGQHYDKNMSQYFFDELKIPHPAVNLEVGSGSHGQQTGIMLEKIERILCSEKPDLVIIYGDTNSTLAAALAAVKIHIPVGHIEAGLRSFNRQMPEEINRIVSDHLSSLLLCPTDTAVRNLSSEGINKGVYQVGDVMYDSVLFNSQLAEKSSTIIQQLKLEEKSFYLATVHRAENTDEPGNMEGILRAFNKVDRPVILPMHPRTCKILGDKLNSIGTNIRVIAPVSYLDMLMLEKNSRLILTDSGGVQKEAYWFKVPCVTLREETEWVELVQGGYNQLTGAKELSILEAVDKAEGNMDNIFSSDAAELYGDGHSSEKITSILSKNVGILD